MHLAQVSSPPPGPGSVVVDTSYPPTFFYNVRFVQVFAKIPVFPTRWHRQVTASVRACEECSLPRGLVLAEVVAAVAQPDELRRTHVRHLRVVPLAFHSSTLRPKHDEHDSSDRRQLSSPFHGFHFVYYTTLVQTQITHNQHYTITGQFSTNPYSNYKFKKGIVG